VVRAKAPSRGQGPRRILFIGANSLYSAAHLAALGQAHGVVAVVETVPPLSRLKRLERRLAPSRLARLARDHGASFAEAAHRDDAGLERALRAARPDLVVVASMGWLLDQTALAVPALGTLNVHPALLPAYRGAEPFFWQLHDGVGESGVTVHLVDAAEDHGPILRQRAFPVPAGASLAEFLARLLEVGPPLLVEAVDGLLRGTLQPIPQPEASPTRRARRLRPADRRLIAWDEWSLERTWRALRGTGPILGWPETRWRDLGRVPVVNGFTAEPAGLPAGRVGRDAAGPFLAHPAGRVRFRRRWAPRAWLAAVRRGGAPASGIIAAEKAAWPPLAALPFRLKRGCTVGEPSA
jgi:methionyl-tRNA formyltransferase